MRCPSDCNVNNSVSLEITKVEPFSIEGRLLFNGRQFLVFGSYASYTHHLLLQVCKILGLIDIMN